MPVADDIVVASGALSGSGSASKVGSGVTSAATIVTSAAGDTAISLLVAMLKSAAAYTAAAGLVMPAMMGAWPSWSVIFRVSGSPASTDCPRSAVSSVTTS